MRAVGVTAFGGPEALHVVDVPPEPLGPGRVRVRVTAAAVSPTDTHLREGAYAGRDPVQEFPYVPGMDAAGVLAEIGPDTDTDLRVGDRVMAIVLPSGAHGAYREDLVLPAASVSRSPAGSTDAEASTLPMNGLTARLALDLMGLRPGQVLAVTGAAGAFGGYVVQLAKADGLTVVADASEADEQLVRDLGADVVVRRGTTSPTGSAPSSPTASTGSPTARCRTRWCCPPCGTAGRWRPCAGTAATARAASRCTRRWSGGSRRTGRRWTGSGSRPRTAC